MNKMQTLFNDLGITTSLNKNDFDLYATAKDTLRLYALAYPEATRAELMPKNTRSAGYSDDSYFTGCEAEEVLEWEKGNSVNLKQFEEEKEKLKEFTSKLKANLSPVGFTRKRIMSETDGEWSMDRKWDIKPFQATEKNQSGILPTIKVNVDFCFSAAHRSKEIAKFGAFCWAVFSSIENAGITCEVNLLLKSQGLFANKGDRQANFTVCVKRAGDYVDTCSLARCFTSGFFRRAIFNLYVAACASVNEQASSGLGHPKTLSKPKDSGELLLSIDNQTENIDALLEKVFKAIGKGNG